MMRCRRFFVQDQGVKSDMKAQRSGISQGCTLSPLLFIMTMTVLMKDAVSSLGDSAGAAYQRGDLADIVYADDTLLLASSDHHLEEFMTMVADAGRLYGMEFHWDKFQLLEVQCRTSILNPERGAHHSQIRHKLPWHCAQLQRFTRTRAGASNWYSQI